LSTHPDPGNRVEYLTKEINEKYKDGASGGVFGEKNFQENVLSQRRMAMRLIDLRRPETWCAMCAATASSRSP
jgi:hypothetical protein